MLNYRWFAWGMTFAVAIAGMGAVYGQNYPNKPIRIVTIEPGASTDFTSRLVADGISNSLRQPVIVENHGGIIPAEIVSRAPPDGYTLHVNGTSFWIMPLLQKASYDPIRDFAPITLITNAPLVLVVSQSSPVNSVKELVALARARPGALNYNSGGPGSPPHLAAELFKAMAGVNIVHIPYKGGGPAVVGVITGEGQLMFATPSSAVPHIKAGKLRNLGVTSAQPSTLFPGVPTVAATVPGYETDSAIGIWAPAKTPEAIINRLNQEIARFIGRPDVKDRLISMGVEATPSSPENFAAKMKSEMTSVGKLIKDIGIGPN